MIEPPLEIRADGRVSAHAEHRERVRLDAIVFDAGTQVRAAISEETVSDYAALMEAGTKFPPVVLYSDGIHYYMADGFHRGHAARRIGATDIPAVITVGTRAEALWFALGANKAHGLKLLPADKRQAILLALKEWPDYSQHRIAEQIGCAQSYVGRIQAEVNTSVHLPQKTTVIGKDGKRHPARRPRQPEPEQDMHETDDEPEPSELRRPEAPRPKPSAPSNGMQFARIAVMKLEEIRENDSERQQAFAHVRSWLDARETQAAMHA